MPSHRTAVVPAAITVRNVEHTYAARGGGRVQALRGVSFDVAAGAFSALIGPNGSGKSTLFRLIIGLLASDAGDVRVEGRAPRDSARRLGVAFQSPALDPQLTVYENMRMHAMLYGRVHTRRTLPADVLAALELDTLLDRRAGELSGGYQRRVELAKVLCTDPAVLVLDEPFNGLDPAARERWFDVLRRVTIARGCTVLLVTHTLDLAERCDDVILLDSGEVLAHASPAALLSEFGASVIDLRAERCADVIARAAAAGIAAPVRLDAHRALFPDLPLTDLLPHVDMARDGVWTLESRRPTLGDVFVARTGRVYDHAPEEVSA